MYKLITPNIKYDNNKFLDIVLQNRGIENKETFINPSKDSLIHYSKLKNIDNAVSVFSHILKKDNPKIAILIDEDLDGYTSASVLGKYIESNFPTVDITYIFHDKKAHGLTPYVMRSILSTHKEKNIDLLLTPDSSSNDYEQHKILKDNGIEIISPDHHEIENGESKHAIVVSPQLSENYENKQISGVGVVYKFLQALDDEYGFDNADDYLDLVALGNVADSMCLTSPETRYLVYEGLKEIKNKFLREIIFKQIGDFDKVYPHTLAFNVIPKINGIIRVGSEEEKHDLFKAFLGREEVSINPKARTKKEETLPQKVTRLCINAHKRQGNLRKKWVAKMKEKIEEQNLNDNAFLLIEMEEDFDRELTGYIAGGLVSEYRKPVLILIWDSVQEAYTGSLRGYDRTMTNTKDFLTTLDLFDHVSGHQNASGFKIKKDALVKLNEAINNALTFSNESNLIEVDFILSEDELTADLIEEVYKYEYIWGKGIEQPTFGMEITLDTTKIIPSNSSSMIKWSIKGIDFVQFTGDERLLVLKDDNKEVVLQIVGTLGVNCFLGRCTPQVMINELEIKEVRDMKVADDFDLFDW